MPCHPLNAHTQTFRHDLFIPTPTSASSLPSFRSGTARTPSRASSQCIHCIITGALHRLRKRLPVCNHQHHPQPQHKMTFSGFSTKLYNCIQTPTHTTQKYRDNRNLCKLIPPERAHFTSPPEDRQTGAALTSGSRERERRAFDTCKLACLFVCVSSLLFPRGYCLREKNRPLGDNAAM